MSENNGRNALAELAERMNSPVEIMPGTGNSLIGLNREQLEAYQKALRIIAELSKVEDVVEVHGLKRVRVPNSWHCYDAVVKCRAIAEEGVKDGK